MSYVQKVLLPDEKVLFSGSLHWVIYLSGLALVAAAGCIALFGGVPLSIVFGQETARSMGKIPSLLSAATLVAGLFFLIKAYVRHMTTELVITNRRIIAKYGFIARSTFEIMLNRITGANFDQTVLGRVLGYGTVIVHGTGGDVSPFDLIGDPQGFHRALITMLERAAPQGR